MSLAIVALLAGFLAIGLWVPAARRGRGPGQAARMVMVGVVSLAAIVIIAVRTPTSA